MKNYLALFLFLTSLSCKKNVITNETLVELTQNEKISFLINDNDFKSFLGVDSEIFLICRNINSESLKKFSIEYQKIKKENISQKEIEQLYLYLGLSDMIKLNSILNRKLNLASKLVNKYQFLSSMSDVNRNALIKEAVLKIQKNYISEITVEDECSSAYAVGLNSCETTFAIESATVSIISAITSIALTPLAGGATFSSGMVTAISDYYSCKLSVVDQWKLCRQLHPL